jgi:hypothetical protein
MTDNTRETPPRPASSSRPSRAYAKLLFISDLLEQADQSAPVEAINRLVEPDGIEPTTSCLQSTRSPN